MYASSTVTTFLTSSGSYVSLSSSYRQPVIVLTQYSTSSAVVIAKDSFAQSVVGSVSKVEMH